MRLEFWKQLLEKSKKKTTLFSNVSPSKDNWISAGAGITGVLYQYVILIARHEARVQLSIESEDRDKNKKIFDELHENKQQIERDFGEQMVWKRKDDQISSLMLRIVENKGLKDTDDWPEIQGKMVKAMTILEKALSKHIEELKLKFSKTVYHSQKAEK